MESLQKATYDELLNIKDIGEVIAKSVEEYFNNENNLQLINKLQDLGLNMNYEGKEIEVNALFSNKTFVLTGTLSSITRNDAKNKIESLGGKVTDSVTSKTSVVIVGENPGSKYDKAIKLGITIWNEQQFIQNASK